VAVAATISSPGVVAALYAAAAVLAVFSAAAELMGRFKDEPLRVLVGRPGLFYLLVNAALAAVVLLALRFASKPNNATLALEQVLLAGFGARILIRTKVVSLRGREGTEEIGPGMVFEQLLSTISREADRDRAGARLKTVTKHLDGLTYAQARPVFLAEIAGAMQDLTAAEKTSLTESLKTIDGNADLNDGTRLDLLGFLVLDYAGEGFLAALAALVRTRAPS
jgi:hypothetical protein